MSEPEDRTVTVVALYNFEAQKSGQLSFVEGETFTAVLNVKTKSITSPFNLSYYFF